MLLPGLLISCTFMPNIDEANGNEDESQFRDITFIVSIYDIEVFKTGYRSEEAHKLISYQ